VAFAGFLAVPPIGHQLGMAHARLPNTFSYMNLDW